MELSARKRAVLAAIIRSYIETGEPVGSKSLVSMLEHPPSPATLRNEMSELSSLGLLCQPHTSAGRVPTGRAYRLYVQSLMKPSQLNESTRRYITSLLGNGLRGIEQLPARAAQVLSELTGFPAIACYEADENAAVRRVELIPTARRAAMLLLVTTDGRTQSRLCRLPQELTPGLEERFRVLMRERVRRMPLNQLNKACLQNVIAMAGLDSLELTPLVTTVFEMAAASAASPVHFSGTPQLYSIFGENAARRLLSFARQPEPLLEWLSSAPGECEVLFGSDSGYPELSGVTMVVAKYRTADRYCGRIGVIGPGRMSYDEIVPSIEYTASQLTRLMTEAAEDMED